MSTDLGALTERLRRGHKILLRQAGEARFVAARGQQLTHEIAALTGKVELYAKAAGVLNTIGVERQTEVQNQIETLVTQGIKTIFADDDLSFHMISGKRDNVAVVDFVLRSKLGDTTVDTDVVDARGGGLAATVGFLLNLVVLLLSPDRRNSPLFLDETFSFLSVEHHEAMAQFLRELVDKTGIQIVMVTHTPALAAYADLIYRFEPVNGETKVARLTEQA